MKKILLLLLLAVFCSVSAGAEELPVVAANQDHMAYAEVASSATRIFLVDVLDLQGDKGENRMLPSGEGSIVWLRVKARRSLRGTMPEGEFTVLARNQKWYASGRFLRNSPMVLFLRPAAQISSRVPAAWPEEDILHELNGAWGKVILRGFDEEEMAVELEEIRRAVQQ